MLKHFNYAYINTELRIILNSLLQQFVYDTEFTYKTYTSC
jgi:hypothetical protein